MKHLVQAFIVGLLTVHANHVWAEGTAEPAQIREGHRLALQICSACHIVGSDQQSAPILRRPGPLFAEIARRRDVSPRSIRAFLQTRHVGTTPPSEMPNPQLLDEQADAIASYLASLKDRRRVP